MTAAQRDALAREREMNLNQDFSCQNPSCGLDFTADTEDGEWPECPLCESPYVERKAPA